MAQTQYAKKGDAHIAYQIVGEDQPLDLVLVSTRFSHVEARWDLPGYAHYLSRLSSFSRLISFDKYGMGLSDPIPSTELPPLEDWMDDVSAVMDAVGLERAAIMGVAEAAPMAELFAATYPERTDALVLVNATARISAAPGYEIGSPPEMKERLISMTEQTWGGSDDIINAINSSLAGDSAAAEAWGRFFRLAASPATAAAVMRMLFDLDVRDVLPTIRMPTLVVHRQDNPIVTVDQGRYVAEHIGGAKFVAVPGADYGLAVGDIDVVLDEVEEFLTGSRRAHATDRVLATVHTFDGPARAVRCAFALRDRQRTLGLDIGAGLHTGEVERRRESIAGIGVHIAKRVLTLAGTGEVLVSRTVRDLVTGSDLTFADRGTHTLKCVPEQWEILEAGRVTPGQADQSRTSVTSTARTGPSGGSLRYCGYFSASSLRARPRSSPSSSTRARPRRRIHQRRPQSSS